MKNSSKQRNIILSAKDRLVFSIAVTFARIDVMIAKMRTSGRRERAAIEKFHLPKRTNGSKIWLLSRVYGSPYLATLHIASMQPWI